MKRAVLLSFLITFQACSSNEPEPFMSYEQYYEYAAYDSGLPSDPNSITALGVGIKRLPEEVIRREITTAPAGTKPLRNDNVTIKYASILSELPALPER